MKILPILKLSLFSIFLLSSCQKEDFSFIDTEECLVEINGNYEIVTLDMEPEYIAGGMDELYSQLLSELSYPAEARENGVEGVAIIRYDITKEGETDNVTIVQDPGEGIGAATKNAFETITTGVVFTAGMLNGEPMRVRKIIKAKFSLGG